jgi:hypothetical protein
VGVKFGKAALTDLSDAERGVSGTLSGGGSVDKIGRGRAVRMRINNVHLGSTSRHFASLFQAMCRVPVLRFAQHKVLYADQHQSHARTRTVDILAVLANEERGGFERGRRRAELVDVRDG